MEQAASNLSGPDQDRALSNDQTQLDSTLHDTIQSETMPPPESRDVVADESSEAIEPEGAMVETAVVVDAKVEVGLDLPAEGAVEGAAKGTDEVRAAEVTAAEVHAEEGTGTVEDLSALI